MKELKFCCDQCDYKTDNNNDLTDHVKNYHGENNLKNYQCDICSKIVKRSSRLREHKLEVHGGQRDRYKCDKCGFSSFRKETVEKNDKAIHLKIKPYQCDICPKGFTRKEILIDHIQVVMFRSVST